MDERDLTLRRRIDLDADSVVGMVVGVVDRIRELLEREAVRRMEGGTLTGEEVERLGLAFMRLERRLDELRREFA